MSLIHQGEVYWLVAGVEDGVRHPHVVVQDDVFNHSRIHTVVVCALTTNLKKAAIPGNVVLDAGEADLPKASVVEVSKVLSVEKARLGEKIGAISRERVEQILAGMRFVQGMGKDRG